MSGEISFETLVFCELNKVCENLNSGFTNIILIKPWGRLYKNQIQTLQDTLDTNPNPILNLTLTNQIRPVQDTLDITPSPEPGSPELLPDSPEPGSLELLLNSL